MIASVRSPTKACLTRKDTLTVCAVGPFSDTPVTVPTFTPAIRTSSSGTRPEASEKTAEYWVPPPMIGSLAALKAAHSSIAITTRPIAPMVVGLREANERPRGAARRVRSGRAI